MKKVMGIVLSTFVLVSFIFAIPAMADTVAEGTCGDNLTWVLDSNGILTISGTGVMTSNKSAKKYEWYSYSSSVTSVIIGDGVESIGAFAFDSYKNITSVKMGNSVKTIGDEAFQKNSKLTELVLSPALVTIGENAFEATNIASLSLPESLTHIGMYAFYECANLKTVAFPQSLKEIGAASFSCSGIEKVVIPQSVEIIGNYAFEDCYSLAEATVYHKTVIGEDAFYRKTVIKGYTNSFAHKHAVANSLEFISIGEEMPVEIVANKQVGSISFTFDTAGNMVVSGTGEVYQTNVDADQPWFVYRTSVEKLTLGEGITKVGVRAFTNFILMKELNLPSTLTSIGANAFSYCENLEELILPSNLETIDAYAFQYSGIKSVDIPEGVTSIGNEAFSWSRDLSEVTLPLTLKNIGTKAFYVTGLTKVTIPYTVASIGDNAFGSVEITGYAGSEAEAYALRNSLVFVSLGEAPSVEIESGSAGGNVVWSFDNRGTLTLTGTGEMDDYTSSSIPWKTYISGIKKVIVEEGITNISKYSFYNCENLTEVQIASTVAEIGKSAFYGTESLSKVIFPVGLKVIGDSAFSSSGIVNLTIPGNVKKIEDGAFDRCDSLTQVVLEKGVMYIGEDVFSDNNALASVTIPYSVIHIGERAFDRYGSTDLEIKGYTKSVAEEYVSNNEGMVFTSLGVAIREVVLTEPVGGYSNLTWSIDSFCTLTLKGEGESAYYSSASYAPWYYIAENVKAIVIEEGVTVIRNNNFYGCINATEATIAESVTSITSNSFYLSSLELIRGVEGSYAETFALSNAIEFMLIGEAVEPEIILEGKIEDNITWTIDTTGVFTISGTGPLPDFDKQSDVTWYGHKDLITKIVVEEGITEIGYMAFLECDKVVEISLPWTLAEIKDKAFKGCASLNKITIYPRVAAIGYYAFEGCPEEIDVRGFLFSSNPSVAETFARSHGYEFKDIGLEDAHIIGTGNLTDTIVWSLSNKGEFKLIGTGEMPGFISSTETPWSNHRLVIRTINIADGITSVSGYAFYSCGHLVSVNIPRSVTQIGEFAFCNSIELGYMPLPDTLLEIGRCAFENTKLWSNEENWEEGVLYLDRHLIDVKESVSGEFKVKEDTLTIAEDAFDKCFDIESVTVYPGVKAFSKGAFGEYFIIYFKGSVAEWKNILGYESVKLETVFDEVLEFAQAVQIEGGVNVDAIFDAITGEEKVYVVGYDGTDNAIYGTVMNKESTTIYDNKVKYVKIFVWDGYLTMKPLGEAKVVQVINTEK